MSKRTKKYGRLFLALHGREERILSRQIKSTVKREVRKLPPMSKENYEGVLQGIDFTEIEKSILNTYKRSGQIGSILYSELDVLKQKKVNPFFSKIWNDFVINTASYLIAEKVVTMETTLISELKKVVTNAIEVGGDLIDIRDEIFRYAARPDFYQWQAMRIARTETTYAMNNAQAVAAEQSGLTLQKQWITAQDGEVRESHQALDGEIVEMSDTFSNGLQYPGDSTGDASEVINCRCTVAYVPVRDESGNLIF